MPKVQFRRSDPYVSGDLIIRIHIDGIKAGSLIGAKPLDLDLAPGTYTVQARMFGVQKGEAIVLKIDARTDALTVAVSGTRPGLIQSPLEGTLTVLISASPWFPLWFFCVKTAVLAIWAGFLLYRWKKIKPQLLRLRVSEGITSESLSSSRRPSSLR